MKKIPLRKCLVTKEKLPKKELFRIVKNKENKVFLDLTLKANGRGAYLKKSLEVINKAEEKDMLSKIFETKVEAEIYKQLKELL